MCFLTPVHRVSITGKHSITAWAMVVLLHSLQACASQPTRVSSLDDMHMAHRAEHSLLVASRVEASSNPRSEQHDSARNVVAAMNVQDGTRYGASPPLWSLAQDSSTSADVQRVRAFQPAIAQQIELAPSRSLQRERQAPLTAESVEQIEQGTRPAAEIVTSFDGLGYGFEGPQGTARFRNPSDNSLAVGPDHIVQTVNTRMAIFTKKGARFDSTGRVLYGPVPTNNVFKNCGVCGDINNGDAVVRYDQLADRWLIVMPIFRRLPPLENEPAAAIPGAPAARSQPGRADQPGAAEPLFQPPAPTPEEIAASEAEQRERRRRTAESRGPGRRGPQNQGGSYAMCYAVSTNPDPLGSYYRYEFRRPLFPDYPRPAVWPDGYYVPTSTGDNVIQKHACVVEREKMLRGEPASEQCLVIDDVNFLNNADVDGEQLPPAGAPNIMLATGGAQLKGDTADDGIYVWTFHVDWTDPARSRLDGPEKITVAPYEYLCGGQLTNCVPQPGTDRRLDGPKATRSCSASCTGASATANQSSRSTP